MSLPFSYVNQNVTQRADNLTDFRPLSRKKCQTGFSPADQTQPTPVLLTHVEGLNEEIYSSNTTDLLQNAVEGFGATDVKAQEHRV